MELLSVPLLHMSLVRLCKEGSVELRAEDNLVQDWLGEAARLPWSCSSYSYLYLPNSPVMRCCMVQSGWDTKHTTIAEYTNKSHEGAAKNPSKVMLAGKRLFNSLHTHPRYPCPSSWQTLTGTPAGRGPGCGGRSVTCWLPRGPRGGRGPGSL